MISDQQRREVAAKMREIAHIKPGWTLDSLIVAAITSSTDAMRQPISETVADLIDRPTCRDVGDGYTFRCSACGCELDIDDREGEPTMWLGGSPMVPRHCPNCGAEVTNGR